ncbi:MAG: carboxypeptidase-like regulatory domain-containing protein [Planctomycetota bacterium]|jgi:hypothetical protein
MVAVPWHWNRPSSWVVLWAGVVVAGFVWHGDLTLRNGPRPAVAPAAAPVVRAKAKAPAPAPVRRAVPVRVLDALGHPLVGAELAAADGVARRSDGEGRATLALAPGEVVDVRVSAPGRVPTWLRVGEGSPDVAAVCLPSAAPWDDAAPPAPVAATVRGEGVVRDGRGEPLADAFVGAPALGSWARTDALGRFALPLAVGEWAVVAHAPGRSDDPGDRGAFVAVAPLRVERARGALPLADLHVGPAASVRGIVRFADGRPAADALVAVVCDGLRRVVATDAGGAFRVGGLPPGPCRVAPLPWRGAVGAAQTLPLDGRPVDVDLTLAAAEPARVRVVAEDGAAVAGAYVAAAHDGVRCGVVQADADGYAAVPWAAGATFDVRVGAAYAPAQVRRFQPEPAQLVVGMP